MCEGGKKKHCSRINDRISEILIANAVWNTFSSSHKKKPVLVSPLKFAPPPSCGWTLLTRQPLIVHLLILRWDWQMKDSVLTVNLSILMWPPVQWKVERARMLTGGGGSHPQSRTQTHEQWSCWTTSRDKRSYLLSWIKKNPRRWAQR